MADNLTFEIIAEGDADWAQKINANLQVIINHTHSLILGTGQLISASYISCTGAVDPFLSGNNKFNIDSLLFIDFINLTGDLPVRNTLYIKNSELYYSNQTRFPVQITETGSLNVHIVGGGGFTGGLSAAGALVRYTSASDLYEFLGNAASPCTLNVDTANVTTQINVTTADINAISFTTLTIINIASASPGDYLLSEGPVYNPALTPLPIANYAHTAALAQQNLLQYNLVQAAVETTYEMNIFSPRFLIPTGIGEDYYVVTSHAFVSSENAYIISNILAQEKGANLFYSIYDRDGKNLPVICTILTSTNIKFNFSNSYDKNLFTPLVMLNSNTAG